MGLPFSWNIRSPSDPLSSRTLRVTHGRVLESLLSLILGHLVIPCLCYDSSDSSFFFAFEGGAHTIEKGTQHFRVRQFGSYLTLCIFAIFATKFLQSCLCKVSLILRFFKPLLLHWTRIFSIFKLEFTFDSTLSLALFGLGQVLTLVLVLLRFVH
jgi:hypothetical protein